MARLPFPIDRLPGLPGLPADVLGALRVLPGMARDTATMARQLAVLGDVAEATRALPELHADMARVAEATESITQIDARMATIESAMPVLVEVQQHLSTLPETMDRLDRRLAQLADQLEALQGSLDPIGRIAQRVPGQRRADQRAAATGEPDASRPRARRRRRRRRSRRAHGHRAGRLTAPAAVTARPVVASRTAALAALGAVDHLDDGEVGVLENEHLAAVGLVHRDGVDRAVGVVGPRGERPPDRAVGDLGRRGRLGLGLGVAGQRLGAAARAATAVTGPPLDDLQDGEGRVLEHHDVFAVGVGLRTTYAAPSGCRHGR